MLECPLVMSDCRLTLLVTDLIQVVSGPFHKTLTLLVALIIINHRLVDKYQISVMGL